MITNLDDAMKLVKELKEVVAIRDEVIRNYQRELKDKDRQCTNLHIELKKYENCINALSAALNKTGAERNEYKELYIAMRLCHPLPPFAVPKPSPVCIPFSRGYQTPPSPFADPASKSVVSEGWVVCRVDGCRRITNFESGLCYVHVHKIAQCKPKSWKCSTPNCGTDNHGDYDTCWKCNGARFTL